MSQDANSPMPRSRRWSARMTAACAALLFSSAQAAVSIDQSPLTVQDPLAPNIVLMLDDSGSMAWNFMPDICYLSGVSCSSTRYGVSVTANNDALINSNNNGIYYDPTITYTPPVQADGTSYADSPGLTGAWVNGFASSKTAVNLTNYGGGYETSYNGGASYGSSNINFSASSTVTSTVTRTSVYSSSDCYNLYQADPLRTNTSPVYSSNKKTCTWTDAQTYRYFQYSTGTATGPYTVRYVADADCGGASNCVLASDTSGVAAPSGVEAGQNIANWFSYYHTRILMAKSGLMNAFAQVDPTIRFGFGSIDGGTGNGNDNYENLPSSRYNYTDSYNSGTNYIAQVQAFSTQKSSFWSWLAAARASGGTPLRQALDAVGRYYQTDQPWRTSSSDTTKLACRQAYTILTTDGFWNESNFSVGNVDNGTGTTVNGPNGQTYTYAPAAPYRDSYSNTLADVAMKYWRTDLQSGVSNEVPPSIEDPAFWQHMTTFTLGMGFSPTGISPSGTTIQQIFDWSNGGASISNFSWPQPSADNIYNIADMAHAAVNGHGGFYSATSPQAFTSALQDAIKRVVERVGTGASLAANSTKLETGTVTYQALYYSGKWKGDMKALAVDPSSGDVATTPTWTAAGALPTAANRNIRTYNPDGNNASAKFPTFSSPSTLSTAQQAKLGANSTVQQAIINYLRGDASNEQKNDGIYRNRDTALGDIVNSQPVYVGAPDANLFSGKTFSGSSGYVDFATSQATRSARIWVAANDGMVHAFNAATGAETFAFLPNAVILNDVTKLATPSYGGTGEPHQFFNDGELTVADAYFGSGNNGGWRSVLVGTTGRGKAKAVYALDVTDPAAPSLLWERAAGDGQTNSSYIGQIIGKPVIAQTSNGTWSVLVGNGYNSSGGTAALLQFDLQSGALSVHATDNTSNNGLAQAAVWMTDATNGISTRAYAGDLGGRVWSFDLSSANSAGTLLFTARDGSNNAQSITGGMLAGKDPKTGNVWLFFGTGRYLTDSELSDTSTQTWYGIIAQNGSSQSATLVSNLSNGRSALVQRQIIGEVAPNDSSDPPTLGSRAITAAVNGDMSGKSGWYLDLIYGTAHGERMVTPNQFQGSLLLGTTRIPESTDPCNPSGSGWIMAIDPFTGGNPTAVFFDLNGDGLFNSSDMITVNGTAYPSAGVGFTSVPNNPIFVGNTMLTSFDNATTSSIKTAGTVGTLRRLSWRELVAQ